MLEIAGRTCSMFVCVHLLHEVNTECTHTSLDVITITHLCDSRLHQSIKKSVPPQHQCVGSVPSCVVFASVACTLHGPWLRTSRMVSELPVAPRQHIMTITDELLARLVNLENEAVQARQRQSSTELALASAPQRILQLPSGDGAPSTPAGVIDTRTLGKPKSFTRQTAEW